MVIESFSEQPVRYVYAEDDDDDEVVDEDREEFKVEVLSIETVRCLLKYVEPAQESAQSSVWLSSVFQSSWSVGSPCQSILCNAILPSSRVHSSISETVDVLRKTEIASLLPLCSSCSNE